MDKVLVVIWKDQEGENRHSEVKESYFQEWLEDNNPETHQVVGKKNGFGKQFR